MNPLDLLKTQLQNALNESTESEDYKNALEDGVYSCQFETQTALIQWINNWTKDFTLEYDFDLEYRRGIKFVEDKWHQITGMF